MGVRVASRCWLRSTLYTWCRKLKSHLNKYLFFLSLDIHYHRNMSFIHVYLLSLLFMNTKCQFMVEPDLNSICGSQDCVIISKCPSVLKLVFKVKAGDFEARSQLLKLQCGFEKSLPKVCCKRNIGATEAPRIFVNSGSVQRPSNKLPGAKKKNILVDDSDIRTDPTPFTTSTTTTSTTTTSTTTTTESSTMSTETSTVTSTTELIALA